MYNKITKTYPTNCRFSCFIGSNIEYTNDDTQHNTVATGDCSDHTNILSHRGELRSTIPYGKAVGWGDVNYNGSGQFRQVY